MYIHYGIVASYQCIFAGGGGGGGGFPHYLNLAPPKHQFRLKRGKM